MKKLKQIENDLREAIEDGQHHALYLRFSSVGEDLVVAKLLSPVIGLGINISKFMEVDPDNSDNVLDLFLLVSAVQVSRNKKRAENFLMALQSIADEEVDEVINEMKKIILGQ